MNLLTFAILCLKETSLWKFWISMKGGVKDSILSISHIKLRYAGDSERDKPVEYPSQQAGQLRRGWDYGYTKSQQVHNLHWR